MLLEGVGMIERWWPVVILFIPSMMAGSGFGVLAVVIYQIERMQADDGR